MQPAPEPDIGSNGLQLVIPADPASVRLGLARLLAMPPLSGLGSDDRGTAELVLAEVLNNVVEHAYSGDSGSVEITLTSVADGLAFLIVDQGKPMPKEQLPAGHLAAVTGVALQDLPEGGFGWHLIRSLTQDLTYVRGPGQNRLRFLLPAGTRPCAFPSKLP